MRKRIATLALCLLTMGLCLSACGQETPVGWQEQDGQQHYYYEDGTMATGWVTLEDAQYYFAEDGALHTGWLELEGKRYYLDEKGILQTGWLKLEDKTYYLDAQGILQTGWLELSGKQHYLDEQGALQIGWVTLEDHTYYLDAENGMQTGWLNLEGKCYYLNDSGHLQTEWVTLENKTYYLDPENGMQTGWLDLKGKRYYLNDSGVLQTGWLKLSGKRYYLDDNGALQTGWLKLEDGQYYFRQDGSMATGKMTIQGETRWFSSTGQHILLANPWNPIPEEYEATLKTIEGWHKVDSACYEALKSMLADCRAAGFGVRISSSYRSYSTQKYLYNYKVNQYVNDGYSQEEAEAIAATIVAVPGTSEHQLGLAVDLTDLEYRTLDELQETMPTQQWLMKNCWKYGFVLRYPNNKTDVTGIIYEPWHYRYLGKELAKEVYDSGLCLEEYLATLS